MENKIGAPARVGAVAPCDVVLNAGPTGLDPGQTSFFQALDPPIPTMIARGQIEIKTNVNLIREGEKVTPSQACSAHQVESSSFQVWAFCQVCF